MGREREHDGWFHMISAFIWLSDHFHADTSMKMCLGIAFIVLYILNIFIVLNYLLQIDFLVLTSRESKVQHTK